MSEPVVARTRTELATVLADVDSESAVVMTMGALHDGHLELVRAARRIVGDEGRVLVTIFVNPLQFGPGEDFGRYPRTFDADLAACAAEGVDIVFAPPRDEMYPDGEPSVTISPGHLGQELEGAVRPTHFAGVLTVVAKLLNLTAPTYAVFGEKDYQQLTLIRRMVTDLDMPYRIVGVPTVREADGLALSSRNRYLSADERSIARALSAALTEGVRAADQGRSAVLAAAQSVLDAHPDLEIDYLALRTPDLTAEAIEGDARLLVAARIGSTRLIDNVGVTLSV
ncbi:pantoate--beta-alanine ligase [Actinobacteria bacterium YIM 96077]|uniref:Pantothenate synthetase n=1 Tax=Phytoactinopolyspora halophila TaxID=1981511 RepID=A0A329R0C4_9ACTN|nr:pantoate--beta-alanine ligase [Phytoactinopolyspora halophila]AYY11476.1 pantoate--beta-alanine ligase [Actinobacteria bacterium YIM 96077]RAW18041.1 pantoate--beta-alanine ligase [Phytoactinopolyspora halophila]